MSDEMVDWTDFDEIAAMSEPWPPALDTVDKRLVTYMEGPSLAQQVVAVIVADLERVFGSLGA